MFNSLKYGKKLEEVGVSREQAEVHMQIMIEIIETNLATKQDMKDLTVALRQEMSELSTLLRHDIQALASNMSQKIGDLAASTERGFSTYQKKYETDFEIHRSDVKLELSNMENRLLTKLGALFMGGIAVLGFVLTFIQMIR